MGRKQEGICGLCFHSPGCGVIVHFDEDDKIDRLTPDPDAPLGSVLCPIADSAKQVVYSEKRIQQPLKRVGPKGTLKFEPISWDEAYDIIVENLNSLKHKYGPETVGFYAGTGSYERSFKDIYQLKGSKIYLASSILFPFGSPNTFGVGAPCYTSLGVLAPQLTMGCLHTDMFSDVDNSDLILVWGTDPSTSTPPEMFGRLITAANEGARIIVIDPRRTNAARLPGSEWLPIRPGSDGALALGLSHILIRDDWVDDVFVEDWTLGYDEFAEYVKEFTPEYVAQLTGIETDRIEQLAEEIADSEGASYVMYTGLEYTKSGVQNLRAVMVLWALAGQFDVEGGRCFARRENLIPMDKSCQIQTPGYEKSIGKGHFPVYSYFCGGEPHANLLPKAILESEPYKIRSLFVLGASILTSWPDPQLWQNAFDELDFMVSIDLQLTRDAAWADIVLPATTAFEQESYCYYGNALRLRKKIIEPVGQSRSCYDILAELANRLEYGHLYPQDSKTLIEQIVKGTGHTMEDLEQAPKNTVRGKTQPMVYRKWEKGLLRKDGKPGFETPSGKFEIKSTILEQFGYNGLPKYEESIETPVSNPRMLKRYPLILGTGPFKPDMKSCLRAIPDFMEKYPYPMVQMNPEDAAARNIKTKDPVVIKTARGSVMMRAYLTEDIMEGFVYAPVGGGGPQGTDEWKKANVNILTDLEQFDPISGFPVYKTLLCQVKKKKRQRRGIAVQDPSLGCVG
ncbi:molybdopterin-containing oxidoreductase family protein [Desulfobacula phenolica]|uniref:Anaerobic selenocysteine-containing dehydrogenase n=1 Tax=Desulfobacula phenolica TaxID=90732 RepID=A0A1H2DNR1_9BACT|nr:molybdopterin-dependent oxidoreductase [Desulfobacula phenolica]SDT83988.1 Anaerobic selenocysteine-containing dehydrogenase [Desulfobacula phenolica]